MSSPPTSPPAATTTTSQKAPQHQQEHQEQEQTSDLPPRNDSSVSATASKAEFEDRGEQSGFVGDYFDDELPPVLPRVEESDDDGLGDGKELVDGVGALGLGDGKSLKDDDGEGKVGDVDAAGTTTTLEDGEIAASKTVDGDAASSLEDEKAKAKENSNHNEKDNKNEQDISATNNATPAPEDENDTPRLPVYINLHNEMMTSKQTLTTNRADQLRLYEQSSHIARKLLNSQEKHGDLPLVMHAHACMVLGCSDEEDCYERMEEAVVLFGQAVREGVVGAREGEEMVKACEEVLGMRDVVGGGGGGGGGGEGQLIEEESEDDEDDDEEREAGEKFGEGKAEGDGKGREEMITGLD